MMNTTHTTRLVVSLLIAMPCVEAVGSVQQFLTASRPWLLKEPVIIVQEAVGKWAGVTYAGYDPASGAWFMASNQTAGGRDPAGQSYLYKPGQQTPTTPPYEPLPYHIGTLLPATILASIHESPGIVSHAENRDGSWFVTYRVTTNKTKVPPTTKDFVARFDEATGRLLSYERADAADRQRIEFDLSDPRIEQPVPSSNGPMHRVTFESDVSTRSFSRTEIVPRVQAASIATQQKLAAISAGYTEGDDGEWSLNEVQPSVVPYAGGAIRTYRFPLIIVGCLVVMVAGFEIIRRNRV